MDLLCCECIMQKRLIIEGAFLHNSTPGRTIQSQRSTEATETLICMYRSRTMLLAQEMIKTLHRKLYPVTPSGWTFLVKQSGTSCNPG
ncbi:hypothetical protein F0562_022146 [Nyssa sinensis]|uniref:Uncharacterized protein n=1 Tax=Nyssa sinensis TaxID=561372 RepID=A0A5J5BN88_9ASTE|nr:hypothetical protein F0562_022146 [Nyssa sinensis]